MVTKQIFSCQLQKVLFLSGKLCPSCFWHCIRRWNPSQNQCHLEWIMDSLINQGYILFPNHGLLWLVLPWISHTCMIDHHTGEFPPLSLNLAGYHVLWSENPEWILGSKCPPLVLCYVRHHSKWIHEVPPLVVEGSRQFEKNSFKSYITTMNVWTFAVLSILWHIPLEPLLTTLLWIVNQAGRKQLFFHSASNRINKPERPKLTTVSLFAIYARKLCWCLPKRSDGHHAAAV